MLDLLLGARKNRCLRSRLSITFLLKSMFVLVLTAFLAGLYGRLEWLFHFVWQVVRWQFSLRFLLYRGAVAFSFGFR